MFIEGYVPNYPPFSLLNMTIKKYKTEVQWNSAIAQLPCMCETRFNSWYDWEGYKIKERFKPRKVVT